MDGLGYRHCENRQIFAFNIDDDLACGICYENQSINDRYVTYCCNKNLCKVCRTMIGDRCPFCRRNNLMIILCWKLNGIDLCLCHISYPVAIILMIYLSIYDNLMISGCLFVVLIFMTTWLEEHPKIIKMIDILSYPLIFLIILFGSSGLIKNIARL